VPEAAATQADEATGATVTVVGIGLALGHAELDVDAAATGEMTEDQAEVEALSQSAQEAVEVLMAATGFVLVEEDCQSAQL
jgi:hypothetical protein